MIPAVLLVGPPAAGKSTVAARLGALLTGRDVRLLQLDTVHRELCPPDVEGRGYHYEQGMLILDDRPRLVAEALAAFDGALAESAKAGNGALALVEFSSSDYRATLSALPSLRRYTTYALHVTAPRATLLRRNALRPEAIRVPEVFLRAAARADASEVAARVGRDRFAEVANTAQAAPDQLDPLLERCLGRWGLR
ncbi:AAA family ATPase [Streptomyces sp. NPDC059900]|uniref:AAA family ATPase n=1 Tax=Streptomyces sp. NPDC059900 TaxID=3155816 RepID=UPI00341DB8E2